MSDKRFGEFNYPVNQIRNGDGVKMEIGGVLIIKL